MGVDDLTKAAPLTIFFLLVGAAWVLFPTVFVVDDSAFYLVIARHLVVDGEHTFSGLYDTNGFHPLWLYLLAAYSFLVSLFDESWLSVLPYAVPLSLLCLVLGTRELGRIARLAGFDALPFVSLPVAFLAFSGVLYSEVHLHFWTLAWLMRLTLDGTLDRRRGEVKLGFVASLALLSRLDTLFFLLILGGILAVRVLNAAQIVRALLSFLLLPTLYFVFNAQMFGSIEPISGWMKSSFPDLHLKGFDFPPWPSLAYSFGGYYVLYGWLPLILSTAAASLGAFGERGRNPGFRRVLLALLVGAWLQALYVVGFTVFHTLWAWYYLLPILAFGFTFSALLASRVGRPAIREKIGAAILFFALLSRVGKLALFPPPPDPALDLIRYFREEKVEHSTIMVSDFPGYLAYFTTNRIIAADMLTSNRRFFEEMTAHPNALEFLFRDARSKGKPVEYVVVCGTRWIEESADHTALVMRNPKLFFRMEEIGRYTPDPSRDVRRTLPIPGQEAVIWRLPSAADP